MEKGEDPPLLLVPSQEDEADLHLAQQALAGTGQVQALVEDPETRARQLQAAHGLLVFAWRIRDDEIPQLENLRCVQSVWAGVDRIPIERLREHHPEVTIASGSGPNAPQVAEHALGLLLDCAKRITLRDRDMRRGGWMQETPSQLVAGSRVAVLGMGAIGRRLAQMLLVLGAQVTAVTRTGSLDEQESTAANLTVLDMDSFHQELNEHQAVILCLPLTGTTRGLVDRDFLRRMPSDGILVNIARGAIIDQEALFDHLQANPQFMAGLDVWWRYPKNGRPRPQDVPFEDLDNIVMTPHSAFNIPGTRQKMIRHAARNIARVLDGQTAENEVP
jgi:phosphoglycerate dehydrogenase-like enzyme